MFLVFMFMVFCLCYLYLFQWKLLVSMVLETLMFFCFTVTVLYFLGAHGSYSFSLLFLVYLVMESCLVLTFMIMSCRSCSNTAFVRSNY